MTLPVPDTVMSLVKLKFSGQVVLEVGVTLAVALSTANGGTGVFVFVGGTLGVGVSVGVIGVGVLVGVSGVGVNVAVTTIGVTGVKVAVGEQLNWNCACGEAKLFGETTWSCSQPMRLNGPGPAKYHGGGGTTFCVPAPAKNRVWAGVTVLSLRTH